MKNVPTLFGCPLWTGKIKRRVAKKWLKKRFRSINYIYQYHKVDFANLGVGDLINNCSSFNVTITEVEPEYYGVRGGTILGGIHFWTDKGGCSLCHCGIEVEQPRDKVESEHVAFLKDYYKPGGGAEIWFGKDSDEFHKNYEQAMSQVALIESGGHICDERGRRL